jgi:hypothetical protein
MRINGVNRKLSDYLKRSGEDCVYGKGNFLSRKTIATHLDLNLRVISKKV